LKAHRYPCRNLGAEILNRSRSLYQSHLNSSLLQGILQLNTRYLHRYATSLSYIYTTAPKRKSTRVPLRYTGVLKMPVTTKNTAKYTPTGHQPKTKSPDSKTKAGIYPHCTSTCFFPLLPFFLPCPSLSAPSSWPPLPPALGALPAHALEDGALEPKSLRTMPVP
jgi:hypothetical protein